MSKKEKIAEKARIRKIEVRFDVARIQDPITIDPDPVELRPQDTEIEWVLSTVGSRGRQASFSEPEFIVWVEGVPVDTAQARFDADRSRLRLPLLGRNQTAEEMRFPYHLRIGYKGTVYTSGGYPAVCDPPPDDP